MKKATFVTALAACAVAFLGSGAYIVSYTSASDKSAEAFRALTDSIEQAQDQSHDALPHGASASLAVSMQDARLSAYRSLWVQNEDLVGWVRVDGANIDLPVMQTKADPEYYLHRDFQRAESAHGTPFLDARCDADASDNLILYGHHMKDQTMFAGLMRYRSAGFRDANPTIQFDTLSQCATYRVIAAFVVSAQEGAPDAFNYISLVNARDAEEFDAYVREVLARSLYDTGETAAYGDRLLTLSTCEYSQEDGRMVVVAKRIDP